MGRGFAARLATSLPFIGLPFRRQVFRRNFTIVFKSSSGGPSANQMQDANTKEPLSAASPDRVVYNQIEDE